METKEFVEKCFANFENIPEEFKNKLVEDLEELEDLNQQYLHAKIKFMNMVINAPEGKEGDDYIDSHKYLWDDMIRIKNLLKEKENGKNKNI